MVKVLSQSGITLADVYNVQGSIAGIEQLRPEEVALVHEMGETIFSERFQTTFRRMDSGDVAQNLEISEIITNLPQTITRLLGIVVSTDVDSRITRASVSVRDPGAAQEIPIWVWDESTTLLTRFVDDSVLGNRFILVPSAPTVALPNFIGARGQGPNMVDEIRLHARTSGFGAGTVQVTALFHFAFSFQAGLSSKGLPIPSW